MTVVVLVHGTWDSHWTAPASGFRAMLEREGFEVAVPPFEWSGDVNGIPSLTNARKHSDWRAGGFCLALYLARLPYEDCNLITHSYGGALAAYAAADYGARIRRLITVACPPRADLEPVWTRAKPDIGYWLNVCDTKAAFIERLAQLWDGHWDWRPKVGQKQADNNIAIPKVGHTGILDDPKHIGRWQSQALLDFLVLPDDLIGGRHGV